MNNCSEKEERVQRYFRFSQSHGGAFCLKASHSCQIKSLQGEGHTDPTGAPVGKHGIDSASLSVSDTKGPRNNLHSECT